MHPTTTTATEDECSSTVKQLQHFVAKPEMHYSLLATDMRGSKLASFCGFTLHWVSWLFQGYKDFLLCTSLSKILLRVSELQDLGLVFDNASILGNASVVCIFSLSHTLRDLRFDLTRCFLCVWVCFFILIGFLDKRESSQAHSHTKYSCLQNSKIKKNCNKIFSHGYP